MLILELVECGELLMLILELVECGELLVLIRWMFVDHKMLMLTHVQYREKGLPLNTLINNAGIMALPNRELTVDGIEKQWGVNHFGPFTLTMLLLDIIEKSDKPRIVNLASSAHKMARKEDFNRDNLLLDEGYGDWSAYGRSKISNIFFTQQLDEYLKSRNSPITVNAIHPGVVATELGRNMDAPEWQKNLVAVFLKKPEDGAKTQVKAALAEEYAEVSGKYMYDEAVQKTNDLAQDKELQQFVWDISLELTGLKEVEDGVWQYVEQQKEQEQEENVEIVSEVEE
eukprot:TRINITY_DN5863_c0_g1_i2.p1 TRINITY_DN5863_c0_g1~~TRINITY_DN5863_c0_g1_i2.p1  ORF type:complete len:285 (-),score=95.90 TRINITY_DN5863_c0_g1_i2:54-908(-)